MLFFLGVVVSSPWIFIQLAGLHHNFLGHKPRNKSFVCCFFFLLRLQRFIMIHHQSGNPARNIKELEMAPASPVDLSCIKSGKNNIPILPAACSL